MSSPYRTPPPAPKLAPRTPWYRRLWNALRYDRHDKFCRATAEAIARRAGREGASWWEPYGPTDYVAYCERCGCPVDSLLAVRGINGWLSFTARCHGQTAFLQLHDLPLLRAPRILYCFRDEVEVPSPK